MTTLIKVVENITQYHIVSKLIFITNFMIIRQSFPVKYLFENVMFKMGILED